MESNYSPSTKRSSLPNAVLITSLGSIEWVRVSSYCWILHFKINHIVRKRELVKTKKSPINHFFMRTLLRYLAIVQLSSFWIWYNYRRWLISSWKIWIYECTQIILNFYTICVKHIHFFPLSWLALLLSIVIFTIARVHVKLVLWLDDIRHQNVKT